MIPFRKTILFLIILIYLPLNISAIDTIDSDWTQEETVTLKWGESHLTGNYTVLAEDFNKQTVQVIISIYKDNDLINSSVMSAGDSIKVSTIKLTIMSIGGCDIDTDTPYAVIKIHTMKSPDISLNINHIMTDDGLANISIVLENIGGIRFTNITLEATLPDDLIPYKDNNKYHTSFDTVEAGHSGTVLLSKLENVSVGSKHIRWVEVEIPALPDTIELSIHLDLRGYDLDNRLFKISRDFNLSIEPAIVVTKQPLHRTIANEDDFFNMNDRLYVLIMVYNAATTDALNLSIDEQIMTSNFVMDPDSPLKWTFDLPARQSRSFTYFLKPIRPGEVQISTTNVSREYKGKVFSKTIDSTTATVYGPYFEITKSLDNYLITPDEKVTVTVNAENTGNHAGFLILTDEIPDSSKLVSGILNASGVVKPGETLSISYTISIQNIGDYRFPAAIGVYNGKHYKGVAYSTRPLIHVLDQKPTPTDTEPTEFDEYPNNSIEPEKNIPGFDIITGSLIFISLYLFKRTPGI